MNNSNLASYLNDHLAGSVAALQLLESMNASTLEPAIATFLAQLQIDIQEDRDELECERTTKYILRGRLDLRVSFPRIQESRNGEFESFCEGRVLARCA